MSALWPNWLGRRRERRAELERRLDEEIDLHLELRTEALVRRGLERGAARAEAIRRFGSGAGTRAGLRAAALERERRMRLHEWMDGFRQDLGYAFRTAAREPGLTAVIVVTLALGIGANATMFGLIDRLLLRGPAHVTEPDELYRIYLSRESAGFGTQTTDGLGYVSYTALRDGTRSFDGVAAYRRYSGTVGRGAAAERADIGSATADFFPLTGVRAVLGRFPNASEDRPPTGEDVVVLGWELWQRRFGGARDVLGRILEVNDGRYTIIGVAPRGFTGATLSPVDVWLPMSVDSRGITEDWPTAWNAQWLRVVGRLKPGVSPEEAAADATAAHRAAYTGTSEAMREARAVLRPLHYDRQAKEPLEVIVSRWLLAVAGVVLLIACANVMNLLLARSTRRRREVAVRLAMGVGRGRLFRLLMLHGLVLAAGGGALALVIVGVVGPVARAVLLPDVAWTGSAVDVRVLLFTGIVALATGVLTSAVPALRAGRRDLTNELRSGIREGGGQRWALRATLTLAQITLTFVLLTGAGLFARSLSSVRGLDLGIQPDRVLAVEARWADPPAAAAGTSPDEAGQARRQRRISFYSNALERVRAVPGVSSAAVAIGTPFESSFRIDLRASGHDSIPGGRPYVAAVTDGYFEVTGLELLEGRTFITADRAGSEPVAIVNRTMAGRLWPDGALGECLYMLTDRVEVSCSRVVGVVENANRFGLREPPAMQYYIPRGQEVGFGGDLLLVRPAGPTDDPQLADALRAALLEVDPGLSWVGVERFQGRIDPQVRPWRLGATLFTLFGGLALLIATIGLYSVIAYMVADRTHEMGVRMVLGADRFAVLGLVLRKSAVLVAVGLLIGAVLALAGSRFIQPALFETSATDPAVLAGVAVVTLVAAFLASVVPAWRAVRVDPVIALRTD